MLRTGEVPISNVELSKCVLQRWLEAGDEPLDLGRARETTCQLGGSAQVVDRRDEATGPSLVMAAGSVDRIQGQVVLAGLLIPSQAVARAEGQMPPERQFSSTTLRRTQTSARIEARTLDDAGHGDHGARKGPEVKAWRAEGFGMDKASLRRLVIESALGLAAVLVATTPSGCCTALLMGWLPDRKAVRIVDAGVDHEQTLRIVVRFAYGCDQVFATPWKIEDQSSMVVVQPTSDGSETALSTAHPIAILISPDEFDAYTATLPAGREELLLALGNGVIHAREVATRPRVSGLYLPISNSKDRYYHPLIALVPVAAVVDIVLLPVYLLYAIIDYKNLAH